MAVVLDCHTVDIWLGQDGYDYPLQVDYKWGWECIIDTVKKAAKNIEGFAKKQLQQLQNQ